ncbi:MAG: alpha-amylase family glycosyl hydrolase [Bacteroidota bacterium]|nr:alpha-amylase family glycosyl hydrolase [Bacteroidota bacterium]
MRKKNLNQSLSKRLSFIYKEKFNEGLISEIFDLLDKYPFPTLKEKTSKWSEKDIILITYGDSIVQNKQKPLHTLNLFLKTYLNKAISTIHILPFFPYSSDDGFSVIDYYKINPDLGNWSDIEKIGIDNKLMFDLVINHISAKSDWFKKFLDNKSPEKNYFIVEDAEKDLSMVTRPRNSPLLTPFNTASGKKYVWTTFSADQIDLNFSSQKLFLTMLDVLLFYISKGAKIIRLDAIAFLWKEVGTTCLHLPETHEITKVFRDIFDYIDPELVLLTETNVPNKENLSYFGDGDEANMVYQFSLPPLLLYSLFSGNAFYFNKWAAALPEPDKECTFFNFTASHDGIGVRPLEGLIPENKKEKLYTSITDIGGKISTKTNSDGSQSAYELNITYFDAMKKSLSGGEEWQQQRFICSQTIMMAFKGIPAFYIHSLLATKNNYTGFNKTKRARTLNRKKWNYDEITQKLSSNTHHKIVLNELIRRIKIRKQHPAFHPESKQHWLNIKDEFIAFKRESDQEDILCISNVTNSHQTLDLSSTNPAEDILSEEKFGRGYIAISLKPYETIWLKAEHNSFFF